MEMSGMLSLLGCDNPVAGARNEVVSTAGTGTLESDHPDFTALK